MSDDTIREPAPLVDGMPPAWREVYDVLRSAQALAVLNAQDRPGDPEAQAILHATSAAVRAFRQEYQRASLRGIAGQLGGEM